MRRALAGLILVGGMVLSSTVFAQQGVIDLEETVIKGRIQKPEAFYILQPANLDYEPFKEKPSFIPELLDTVNKESF
jgi:hypothetical protein